MFKRQADVHELMNVPVIHVDGSGFSEDMPRMFDSSTDADVFEAVDQRQKLLPVLPNGNAVAMVNPSFHESEKIQEPVEAAGCLLEFLPPQSPDLDPIEHEWAQAKARRRKLGYSVDGLFRQPGL